MDQGDFRVRVTLAAREGLGEGRSAVTHNPSPVVGCKVRVKVRVKVKVRVMVSI